MWIKKIHIFEIKDYHVGLLNHKIKGYVEILLDNNNLITKVFEISDIWKKVSTIEWKKKYNLPFFYYDNILNKNLTQQEIYDLENTIQNHCRLTKIEQLLYKNPHSEKSIKSTDWAIIITMIIICILILLGVKCIL